MVEIKREFGDRSDNIIVEFSGKVFIPSYSYYDSLNVSEIKYMRDDILSKIKKDFDSAIMDFLRKEYEYLCEQ